MSRNLCDTACRICCGEVKLEGEPHPITADECSGYVDEYIGKLIVANARCESCNAKYLAWVAVVPGSRMDCGHWKRRGEWDDRPFVDMSFRRAFNDEPAPEDLPSPEMLRTLALREHDASAAEMQDAAVSMWRELVEFLESPVVSHWEAYRR